MPRQPDTLQGTLDLLVLKTLEREPNDGFGITLHIQQAGALQVEEGSLYPALHRMERNKLIKGLWKVSDNGRRARYYKLTQAGVKRLAEAEESWSVLSKSVAKVLGYV